MLQQEKPEDYVIATGITTTVREFARLSFEELGIFIEFAGKHEQEKGDIIDWDNEKMTALGLDPEMIMIGKTVVKVDTRYFRPTEVEKLIGDASKAFKQLRSEMPTSELQSLMRIKYHLLCLK